MNRRCCGWMCSLLIVLGTLPSWAQDPNRAAEPPTINLRRTVTVDVVHKTKDAVVYISTTRMVSQRVSPFPEDFFPGFDMGFGQVVRVPTSALGSGFIVHPDGYIVTNNHVIDRARQIKAELADGRKLDAELISADPEADLAILKVNSEKPLPALELGDSAELLIGEPVIAVGNPLGFSHSVSTGIVSAVHRDLKGEGDKVLLGDLIQTDAAINRGNSGGPLLNAYGQVIGINTAIRGDAQNIGFAIQVNKLRDMVPRLLSPDHAAKLEIPIKLSEKRQVSEPSTVKSEVMLEDGGKTMSIESINGHKPQNIIDAYAVILKTKAGETVTVKLAGGEERKVTAQPVAPPEAVALAKRVMGITVEQVTPALAQKMSLFDDTGILVTQVQRGSLAAEAGLQAGDVIIQLAGVPLAKLDDLALTLEKINERARPQARVMLVVRRGDATLTGPIIFRRRGGNGESI